MSAAAQLARHRKAATIDTKDVQLVLERNWNMWIPGFNNGHANAGDNPNNDEDVAGTPTKGQKRSMASDAHRARMAIIKKALKKY